MRKIFTISAAVALVSGISFAQQQEDNIQMESTFEYNTGFFKTPPLRDLFKTLTPVDENAPIEKELNHHERNTTLDIDYNDHTEDPNVQTTMGTRDGSNWTKANWAALTGSGYPPDPTGAAGQDYYVQAVNSKYRVYNKDGSGASGVFNLSSLYPMTSSNDGDPIVMYDRFADRWFISQFGLSGNKIFIAVSETADPLGAYYAYEFSFSSFPDYPKYSVWSNAYFMTANTSGPDCVAFEREKMLLGDPTAGKINMYFPSTPMFFNSVAPAYAEGPTAPEADEPCYFFIPQEAAWSGSITYDHIKIFKAEIDWVAGTGSVSVHQQIADDFDAVFTSSWDDITQKGTSQKLDAVAGIYMYRAQYRRFVDYNVCLLTMTVDVSGTNRAGVHWVELRDNNDGTWYIYQEGTYAPDATNSRWMGNCAMDQQGNIALAYCFAGPNEYAGIRYTGRYANDPLGEMTVQEQIGVEGVSYQNVTNRWGDYSQMAMDPSDDMTFWFTGEYAKGLNNPGTRVISFSSWHLAGTEEQQIEAFFTAYQPDPTTVRLKWHSVQDDQVMASLVDMNGKVMAQEQLNADLETVDFIIPETASGIYLVTLTGSKTNLSKKIYISK